MAPEKRNLSRNSSNIKKIYSTTHRNESCGLKKKWQSAYNALQEREGSKIDFVQGIPDHDEDIVTDTEDFGWLVVLRLNVPVNNFSVISGRSHRFLGN